MIAGLTSDSLISFFQTKTSAACARTTEVIAQFVSQIAACRDERKNSPMIQWREARMDFETGRQTVGQGLTAKKMTIPLRLTANVSFRSFSFGSSLAGQSSLSIVLMRGKIGSRQTPFGRSCTRTTHGDAPAGDGGRAGLVPSELDSERSPVFGCVVDHRVVEPRERCEFEEGCAEERFLGNTIQAVSRGASVRLAYERVTYGLVAIKGIGQHYSDGGPISRNPCDKRVCGWTYSLLFWI